MKKAIKYLRFSSDGQSQHSIERQEIITAGWTTYNKIAVIDTFIDEGYSARTFDRPDMNALMSFIKKNYRQIDYLVVAELSRFSREAGDAINLVTKIQRSYNIQIVSASSSNIFDVNDSNSFLLMGLEFLISNSENIKRTNDINGGIYAAKKDGRWIQGGPAPFGYTKEGVGKERKMIVKEAEAIVIRFIFNSFLANMPVYIIADKAKAMGLKRKSNSVIQEMLSNPLYMSYQLAKPWKEHAGGLFAIKDLEKIIDDATWYRVQEKLNTKTKPRISVTDTLPLRGVLKCHCHKPLTGAPSRSRSGKYINYYKCQTSGHTTLNANKAHLQLEEILQLMSLPQRLIIAIKNKSEALLNERLKESNSLLQVKQHDLIATENKLQSIEEKFIANQLNFESYNKWHGQLSTQRYQLRTAIDTLQKDGNQVHFLLQNNLGRLSDLHHIYSLSSTVQKQELLRQVFDNGLYYRDSSYRTPFVMPVFTHNLLTLKQKSLLFVDGWNEESGGVEANSLLSNHFMDFLSFLETLRAA